MVSDELLEVLKKGHWTELEMIFLYNEQIEKVENPLVVATLQEILGEEGQHAKAMQEIIEFLTDAPYKPSYNFVKTEAEAQLTTKQALEKALKEDVAVEEGADRLYVHLISEEIDGLLDRRPDLLARLKTILEQTKQHREKLTWALSKI